MFHFAKRRNQPKSVVFVLAQKQAQKGVLRRDGVVYKK
jgi:hypothetical protein